MSIAFLPRCSNFSPALKSNSATIAPFLAVAHEGIRRERMPFPYQNSSISRDRVLADRVHRRILAGMADFGKECTGCCE